MHGEPLVNVDETAPLRPDSKALYSRTKARAEQASRDATGSRRSSCARASSGAPGDTTILPALADAVRGRRFAWIGGGRHRTSTTHVDNVVEGLMLGADEGRSRARPTSSPTASPSVFRDFVTRLLATQGVEAPDRSLPRARRRRRSPRRRGARGACCRCPAAAAHAASAFWLASQECTIDISRARRSWATLRSRSIDEGMEELRSA